MERQIIVDEQTCKLLGYLARREKVSYGEMVTRLVLEHLVREMLRAHLLARIEASGVQDSVDAAGR